MTFGGVGGTTIDAPSVATVTVAANGDVQVSYALIDGKVHALRVSKTTNSVLEATARQYTILTTGRTAGAATCTPNAGDFGAKATWATISMAFRTYTIGKKAVRVPRKLAANTPVRPPRSGT